MGYKIAKCKTKFGIQIRVIQHINNKSKYIKSIGTAKNDIDLNRLLKDAEQYINNLELNLWADTSSNENSPKSAITKLDNFKVIKILSSHTLKVLSDIYDLFKFPDSIPLLFKHLVILRIIEPKSKKASVELLKQHFDLEYTLDQIYFLKRSKNISKGEIVKSIFKFTQEKLNSELSIIFYDVTTLYFESFKEDELKQFGFSKDHKFNQVQIVLGLLVNIDGFPLYYEIYEGNKFEGKTFIPSIKDFMKELKISSLTIVADSAMMSKVTFQDLEDANLKYIVGARVSNLSIKKITEISNKLNKIDSNTYRVKTDQTKQIYLVTKYSSKRATKDEFDMLKQITKAQFNLSNNIVTKSSKFLKRINKEKFELNSKLIEKTKLLLGIKGYYTNVDTLSNEMIVSQYSNLWKIEHNFRVSKTDLDIRPIYHWKPKGIQFHILLNFVSLAISRYIELKNNVSINSFVKESLKTKEVVIQNNDTKKLFILS